MGQPPIKAITEAADAVTTATKALWDHINSLAGEQRDKAIAYQQRLEKEAAEHPNGMNGVILDHLKHNNMLMMEHLHDTAEHFAGIIGSLHIGKAKEDSRAE